MLALVVVTNISYAKILKSLIDCVILLFHFLIYYKCVVRSCHSRIKRFYLFRKYLLLFRRDVHQTLTIGDTLRANSAEVFLLSHCSFVLIRKSNVIVIFSSP